MMEELGSHEDDDQLHAAVNAGHDGADVSVSMREAAQTNVPESNCASFYFSLLLTLFQILFDLLSIDFF